MQAAASRQGVSPALDLSNCASEPIHAPGSIQPHGALIAALADGLLVTHASANLASILGLSVDAVLGRPLHSFIDEAACSALTDTKAGRVARENVHELSLPDGRNLLLRAHRTGKHICVDIEPPHVAQSPGSPISMARATLSTFENAASVVELCDLAVQGLKAMSGYNRVMAYRFWDDGHGEVIAEARDPSLTAYLGQHYPASDIPPQARLLYLRQRVGAIADASFTPVPLCTDPTLDDGVALDLTHSSLRSPSPVHCQYMRNMDTSASLTISLTSGGSLWGMLLCHDTQPRRAGFELRAAADLIGQVVSLLLASAVQAELLTERLERNSTLRTLTDHLAARVPLSDAMTAAQAELLDVVQASGAAVRLGGTMLRLGSTPSAAVVQSMLALLQSSTNADRIAIQDLGVRHPEFAASVSEASGALFLKLVSGEDDAILWFRPEMVRTIVWGGDPAGHTSANPACAPISPRASFAAWKETLRGQSAPWTGADMAQAAEVRNALQGEVAKRAASALRETQAQLGLIVEHSSDVIMMLDLEGIRRYVSPSVERLLGWRPEELVGTARLGVTAAPEITHPDDRQIFVDARSALQGNGGGDFSMSFRLLRRDDSWLWVDGRARLHAETKTGDPTSVVVALHDATARRTVELKLNDALEQMGRMAAIDGLTGLFNRRHFDFVAELEWRRCGRQRQPLSVLLLDVDHFKLFNDQYGHLAGDECLRAIASQLTAAARRPGDLIARFGGEEFLVLMPFTDRAGATCVAERVRDLVLALAIPHKHSPTQGVVTVSVGAATASLIDPTSGPENFGALLAAADIALYQAKSRGRNRVAIADP